MWFFLEKVKMRRRQKATAKRKLRDLVPAPLRPAARKKGPPQ